jgi:hypothetical protein
MIKKEADSIKTGYIEYWKSFFMAADFLAKSAQRNAYA